MASFWPEPSQIQQYVAHLAGGDQLPPELAVNITADGMFLQMDPETETWSETNPALIRELRPYIAAAFPDYARAYYWGVTYPLGPLAGAATLPTVPTTTVIGGAGQRITLTAPPTTVVQAGADWVRALIPPAAAPLLPADVGAVRPAFFSPSIDPVSVTINIIGAIATLFRIFGGAISGAAKIALEGMRASITSIGDGLLRFAWQIARAAAKILSALHNIWVRVIWPLLRAVPKIVGRLHRLITRDLPRLLKAIQRIRDKILEIYEKWARPILKTIQAARQMLLVLRLFHIKWAEKLDAKLVEMQRLVMLPIQIALEHLAIIEQWINTIVTAEQLIQDTIFHNSIFHYQDPLVKSLLGAFSRPLDPLEKADFWPRHAAVTAEQTEEHWRIYKQTGGGPIGEDVAKALRELRALPLG